MTSSARRARIAVANVIAIDRNRTPKQPPRTRAAMPMRPIVAGSREAVKAIGRVSPKRFGLRVGAHGGHALYVWCMCLIANGIPPAARPGVHKNTRVDRRLRIWRQWVVIVQCPERKPDFVVRRLDGALAWILRLNS